MTKLKSRRVIAGTLGGAIGLALIVGSPSSTAQAATRINASLGLYVNDASGYNPWDNAWINVRLPMSQYDAQGYINNGAQVEIRCWGDDYFFDDDLFRDDRYVYTGTTGDRYWIPGSEKLVTGVNRLYADTDGVRLTAIISYKHLSGKDNYPYKGFNEDTWPESDTDEVYCNALWTDGDGGRIGAFTNVVKGTF